MISTGGFRDEDGSWDVVEYKRDYYLRNKERISDRNSEKIPCDCSGSYTYNHKARHFKTKRHLSSTSVFFASPIANPDDDPVCHSD